jgi:HEXXH motif-containing protein
VATVRIAASRVEVVAADVRVVIPANYHDHAPGWRPLSPVLTDPFELVVDDVDPFRMPSAPRLAAAPDLGSWRSAFREAWALLDRCHPVVAADVAAVIKVAVPLATPPHGQVSSSSPETFGAIALSQPLDPCDLAVTLTHEVQHMKLSALLDLVPLTRPDNGSVFYAPWRDDPRPASGLLQGAYAYLGVTGFWRRQREVTRGADTATRLLADSEFARWREGAALASRVLLSSGRLTEDGAKFVRGMAATLRAWQHEPVPELARRLAAEKSERHMSRWRSPHPIEG